MSCHGGRSERRAPHRCVRVINGGESSRSEPCELARPALNGRVALTLAARREHERFVRPKAATRSAANQFRTRARRGSAEKRCVAKTVGAARPHAGEQARERSWQRALGKSPTTGATRQALAAARFTSEPARGAPKNSSLFQYQHKLQNRQHRHARGVRSTGERGTAALPQVVAIRRLGTSLSPVDRPSRLASEPRASDGRMLDIGGRRRRATTLGNSSTDASGFARRCIGRARSVTSGRASPIAAHAPDARCCGEIRTASTGSSAVWRKIFRLQRLFRKKRLCRRRYCSFVLVPGGATETLSPRRVPLLDGSTASRKARRQRLLPSGGRMRRDPAGLDDHEIRPLDWLARVASGSLRLLRRRSAGAAASARPPRRRRLPTACSRPDGPPPAATACSSAARASTAAAASCRRAPRPRRPRQAVAGNPLAREHGARVVRRRPRRNRTGRCRRSRRVRRARLSRRRRRPRARPTVHTATVPSFAQPGHDLERHGSARRDRARSPRRRSNRGSRRTPAGAVQQAGYCDCGEPTCGICEPACGLAEPGCGILRAGLRPRRTRLRDRRAGAAASSNPGCGLVEPGCGCGEPDCGIVGCGSCVGNPGPDYWCFPVCLPRFKDLRFWAGVHGFKGPRDAPLFGGAGDGNFGFQEGVNIGGRAPLVSLLVPAAQLPARLPGRAEPALRLVGRYARDDRSQQFVTAGVFRRVPAGVQFGVVWDMLRDDFQAEEDFHQLRYEISLKSRRAASSASGAPRTPTTRPWSA